MPTYEFRCPKGHEFEKFYRSIGTAPSEVHCPECGELAERQLSAGAGLVFKGSGFYITDYGKDGKKDQRQSPGKVSGGSSEKSGADGSSSEKSGSDKSGSEKSGSGNSKSGDSGSGGASDSSSSASATPKPSTGSSESKPAAAPAPAKPKDTK